MAWNHTTLEKYIDLLTGFAFKSSSYIEDEDENSVRLLRGDNIVQNRLRWDNVKRYLIKNVDNLDKYFLFDNDIVIAMDRTWVNAGMKLSLVKKEDLPCLLVQRVARIRAKEELNQFFLFYLFNSYRFEQYVKGVQTETAIPHISAKQIKEFSVSIPPIAEQRKIAEILGTCDRQIELTEKAIEAKRKLKRGLMQKLLTGKLHFSEFEGQKWISVKLKDIAIFTNGKAHESDISETGKYIVVNSKFISSESAVQKYSNSCLCPVFKDEILMVMSDVPNGQAIAKCFYVDCDNKYTLNQRICSLKINKENPKFIFYILNRNDYFLKFDDGVKQTNLRKSEVLNCPLNIPLNILEQEKIVDLLNQVDLEMEKLIIQVKLFKSQKKGLMQQLLTGKTRVKVD